MSNEERERTRRSGIFKAQQEAKKAGVDWDCLPEPEREARMLTEIHRMGPALVKKRDTSLPLSAKVS